MTPYANLRQSSGWEYQTKAPSHAMNTPPISVARNGLLRGWCKALVSQPACTAHIQMFEHRIKASRFPHRGKRLDRWGKSGLEGGSGERCTATGCQ